MSSRFSVDRPIMPILHLEAEKSDSSTVIDSEDSSLVGDSDSFEASPRAAAAAPRMRSDAATVASTSESGSPLPELHAIPPHDLSDSEYSVLATAQDEAAKVLILRTYSVDSGRRRAYGVQSLQSDQPQRFEPAGACSYWTDEEATAKLSDDSKALRLQVARMVRKHQDVYVDLSHNWSSPKGPADVRATVAPGLLGANERKKITIDLSNHRLADLREGARVRNELRGSVKAWQASFVDAGAGVLAHALRKELVRVGREQGDMPKLDLICHDQPLAAVVSPIVRTLAQLAAQLPGLQTLDLNRYSRSSEVGEAWPLSADGQATFASFVEALAQLLRRSPSLTELSLRLNGLGSYEVGVIADALADNATLERLDLSCNPLWLRPGAKRNSLSGVLTLAAALTIHPKITAIDLSYCGIDEHGANMLQRMLMENPRLQQVKLSCNPIRLGHPIFNDRRVSTISRAS